MTHYVNDKEKCGIRNTLSKTEYTENDKEQNITVGWACVAYSKSTHTRSTRRESSWEKNSGGPRLRWMDLVRIDVEALEL